MEKVGLKKSISPSKVCKKSWERVKPLYFNNWHNLLFTGAKEVYEDLVNITTNLDELKSLQSNLSVKINETNVNLTSACGQIPLSNCPQLPDLSNDFTVVSCVIVQYVEKLQWII